MRFIVDQVCVWGSDEVTEAAVGRDRTEHSNRIDLILSTK